MFPKHKTGKKAHPEENSAENGVIHRFGKDVVPEEKAQKIVHLAHEGIAGEDVPGDEIESMMEEIEFRHGKVVNQGVFACFRRQDEEKNGKQQNSQNDRCRNFPEGTQ